MTRDRSTKPADDSNINTDSEDDTEGHGMHWSDAEVKHDVTPIGDVDAESDDEDLADPE